MTNLVSVLALAEKAREDMYFAEIDRQLVALMHARAGRAAADGGTSGPGEDVEAPSVLTPTREDTG